MKKQYSIPDEVMTATARVLQNYRQRLEGEIKILVRASEGNRRDLRLDTLQDALLEAADRHKVYDHVEIELI